MNISSQPLGTIFRTVLESVQNALKQPHVTIDNRPIIKSERYPSGILPDLEAARKVKSFLHRATESLGREIDLEEARQDFLARQATYKGDLEEMLSNGLDSGMKFTPVPIESPGVDETFVDIPIDSLLGLTVDVSSNLGTSFRMNFSKSGLLDGEVNKVTIETPDRFSYTYMKDETGFWKQLMQWHKQAQESTSPT